MKRNETSELSRLFVGWLEGLETHKSDRAKLRRCERPQEAYFFPYPNRLIFASREKEIKINNDWLMFLAVLGAHMDPKRFEENLSMAEMMGRGEQRPSVSEMRFQNLLRHNEPEELLMPLVRAIKLLDRKSNPHDLANSLWRWSSKDPKTRDRVKMDWATSYYAQIETMNTSK